MGRFSLAFRGFFSILSSGTLPAELAAALGLARKDAGKPAPSVGRPVDGAMQLLGLLQREARLVDFLMEDIQPYTDEQVGAAMRGVHQQCRQVLARHAKLVPVIDGVEGTYTRIAPAAASEVKLIGKVPPQGGAEGGTLRHKGWRADKIVLPPLAPGENAAILAPAEVEVE